MVTRLTVWLPAQKYLKHSFTIVAFTDLSCKRQVRTKRFQNTPWETCQTILPIKAAVGNEKPIRRSDYCMRVC
jgi:hypothetical protein